MKPGDIENAMETLIRAGKTRREAVSALIAHQLSNQGEISLELHRISLALRPPFGKAVKR